MAQQVFSARESGYAQYQPAPNRHQEQSQMNPDRMRLLDDYWAAIEKDQDYTSVLRHYLPESLLVDPIYGPFRGVEEIGGFLEKVTEDMRDMNVTFSVVEKVADENAGWSRWTIHLPDGSEKDGVSVYRFQGDKILVQRDFISTNELG